MKLIVGLGNPGRQYNATRHNVGFMVVERFSEKHRAGWTLDGTLNARCARLIEKAEEPIQLVEPQTMMNDSGRTMQALQQRWNQQPQDLLIVCDDVNLPLGTLRLRDAGSAGGHHGLASCLDALGTEAVPRLRVGVGVERLPRDLTEFVLAEFRPEERPGLDQALDRAVEACEWWVREGIQAAMNHANPKPQHEGNA